MQWKEKLHIEISWNGSLNGRYFIKKKRKELEKNLPLILIKVN